MKKIIILILAIGFFAACESTAKKGDKANSETTSQVVEYEEVEINVTGMTCTGCEKTVENGLKQVDGVKEVRASHKNNKVTIKIEKDKVNREALAQKIETVGYAVTK